MSADRTGCCETWPKPCSYHEGYADALDTIEMLVVRDPDMADEVTVWIGGVDVTTDMLIVNVDAGAGYSYDDWVESAAGAVEAMRSSAARQAVAAAYADPPGKQYIDNFPPN